MRFRALSYAVLLSALVCVPVLRADAPPSLQSNLMNPLISLTGLFQGEAGPDLGRAEDGRYHFGLQAAELTLESTVDSYFKLNANLVYSDEEVTAEEVFATTRSLPQVQAKIGKFKATFGKLGNVHEHAFPFIAQALAYERTIGEEGFNGGGVEAAWMAPLPWFFELTGGAFSSAASEEGSPVDWSGARKDDFVYDAHVRNFFDLPLGTTFEAGASALSGHTAVGETQRVVGVDATFKHAPALAHQGHPWNLQAEWLGKRLGGLRQEEGWYAHGRYRVFSSWWLGARSERVARLPDTPGEDGGAPTSSGKETRQTLELTWAPGEFSAVRLDGSYASLEGASGRSLDRRVTVQFIHTIGTHPAHNY